MGYSGLNPMAERTYMASVIMDLAKQQQVNTTNITVLTGKIDEVMERVDKLVEKVEEGDEKGGICRREVDHQIQQIAISMEKHSAVDTFKWKLISVISILIAIATFVLTVVRPLVLGG